MEKCVVCGKPIDKEPHITCATCKATTCYSCYEKLKDKTQCPNCVKKRSTVRVRVSSDLAVSIAQNVGGSDFNDKLLRCLRHGYSALVKA